MTILAAKNHPIDCGSPTTDFGSRRFAKAPLGGRSFRIDGNAVARELAGDGAANETYKDKVYGKKTSASYVTDYEIQVSGIEPDYAFSGSVSDEAGCLTVSESDDIYAGVFSAAGTAKIVASDFQGQTAIEYFPVAEVTGGTLYTFLNYAESSLAEETIGLLDRLQSEPVTQVFSTQDPATQTYIRDSSCWVSDLDFTSKGVWNSSGGFGMGGCLLTERHAVFTAHLGYHPRVGTVIHFVGRDAASGQPEQVAAMTVSHVSDPLGGDQVLVRLSEAVPSFITPAKILPPDFEVDYLPQADRIGGAPFSNPTNITNDGDNCTAGLWIDKANNARLRLLRIGRDSWTQYWVTFYQQYHDYAPRAVPGDSGTPVYAVINGTCVYVGNHSSPLFGNTLSRDQPAQIPFSQFIQESPLKNIRDQITAWGDSETIETVDLSAFTSY